MRETGGRAISTVFDVTLCLLLVSASAFVIVGAQSAEQISNNKRSTAESTANVLVTSTAEVNYTIRTERESLSRRNYGTFAGLLTEAAVANTTVYGSELTRTSGVFETAVENTIRERTAAGNRTSAHIVVRWRPYRNAHIRGVTSIGNSPPHDATVHAASLSVPSGLPVVRDDAVDAARRNGYRGVARVVATGIVSGLFPKHSTSIALRDRTPVADSVAGRFRRLRGRYDADSLDDGNDGDGTGTRQMLVRTMTTAVEFELRETFESPEEAARSVSVGRAELVVRTWSM
ncbi:DUF7284 family protein [Haladaptatus pallidirubidus]|uniref:Flagellin n=1 Tax=Haladaptatus pallidirubidus TaxID=1008152 RepID=A0AAV3UKN7_9EURY|nr:hypothetical protein [Haladaptatus pallidirubidus]